MRCNAGRNYLFVSPTGEISRCFTRSMLSQEIIGHIDSFNPLLFQNLRCEMIDICSKNWREDWDRSSRIDDSGKYESGVVAAHPEIEIVSSISLTHRNNTPKSIVGLETNKDKEIEPQKWKDFLDRSSYFFTTHCCIINNLTGDPLFYSGVVDIVEFLVQKNFLTTICSSLCVGKVIDEITRFNSKNLQFIATMPVSKLDFHKFFGRVMMVKGRGHHIQIMLYHPTQMYLIDYWKKFFSKYEIPTTYTKYENLPQTEVISKDLDGLG